MLGGTFGRIYFAAGLVALALFAWANWPGRQGRAFGADGYAVPDIRAGYWRTPVVTTGPSPSRDARNANAAKRQHAGRK